MKSAIPLTSRMTYSKLAIISLLVLAVEVIIFQLTSRNIIPVWDIVIPMWVKFLLIIILLAIVIIRTKIWFRKKVVNIMTGTIAVMSFVITGIGFFTGDPKMIGHVYYLIGVGGVLSLYSFEK